MFMEEQVARMGDMTVRKSESGPAAAAIMVEANPKMRETFFVQAGKSPLKVVNRVSIYLLFKYFIAFHKKLLFDLASHTDGV